MTDSMKSTCLPNIGREKTNKISMLVARLLGLILLILLLPVLVVLGLMVLVFSGKPIVFRQRRVGFLGTPFWMYKFRTMYVGAEKDRNRYISTNEADGPVFKIKDDPRFTKIGRFLSHSGLDELLQLINVCKGDMALVGPRPLPVYEENKIPKQYRKFRQLVLPGIISTWVLKGNHHSFSFDDWMRMDEEYIKNKSFFYDLGLFLRSLKLAVILIAKAI